MRLNIFLLLIILMLHTTAWAEIDTNLPANSRIFYSEKDCIEVIKSQHSWNIEFAASLRDMEKHGKLVRYPQKVPITILEEKLYTRHKYYRISINDSQANLNGIFWTDALRFE